jgi:hypothetical protein
MGAVNDMILALRHEYDEMGRALMCPICRSTLREAIILPCVHAFCHGCLRDYYNPPTTTTRPTRNGRGGRRGAPSSPPRKPKAECPVCKTANPGKRSGERCPHLDEMAKAYKTMGRAFSFAPVRFAADVVMTQLDPRDDVGRGEDSDSGGEEEEEEEEEEEYDGGGKMHARERIASVREYEQHLQVAKAVQAAFAERAEESQQSHPPAGRGEEMENRMKVRRYRQMAKEQEAVVRADERTLDREVRKMGGRKRMVASVIAAFDAEAETVNRNDAASSSTSENMELLESKEAAAGAASDTIEFAAISTVVGNDLETKHTAPLQNEFVTDNEISGKFDTNLGEEIHISKVEKAEYEAKAESTVGEDVFCTAPDESQAVEYYTAREESQATSTLNISAIQSPTVIRDGNTAKKADRPKRSKRPSGTNVRDSEGSPQSSKSNTRGSVVVESSMRNARVSMATAATASGSPVVLHDGNTVRKSRHETKNRGVSLLDSDFVDDPTPRRSGNMSPLPAVDAASVIEAAENTDTKVASNDKEWSGGLNIPPPPKLGKPAAASVCQAEQRMPIANGTIVFVQARTWPGINKPGGVARVTKVHPAAESGSNSTKYNVAYVLGGKENQVDESFVTLDEADEPSTIEGCLETSMTTGSMSAEKKRPMRHRRVAIKPEHKSSAAASASFPIYNDEELKHIPEDVLKWAGIVPKEKKKKSKADQAPGIPSKHNSSEGKKRVLKESNILKSNSTKKHKPVVKEAAKTLDTKQGFRDSIRLLPNEEIVSLADARYSQLLLLDEKQSPSETHLTFYAVTSSLTDKESEMLDSLCQVLKGKSGKHPAFYSSCPC